MKGICFIEPLHGKTVKRIKVQTRRIISPQPEYFLNKVNGQPMSNSNGQYIAKMVGDDLVKTSYICPRYNVGDILYLKEPYYILESGQVEYRYEPTFFLEGCVMPKWEWKNKLFMPASAARHFIKITAVRAERLQDISGYDCIKEGIEHTFPKATSMTQAKIDYDSAEPGLRKAYATLIDKINGKGTWNNNPWVWVYDYELIDRKEVQI